MKSKKRNGEDCSMAVRLISVVSIFGLAAARIFTGRFSVSGLMYDMMMATSVVLLVPSGREKPVFPLVLSSFMLAASLSLVILSGRMDEGLCRTLYGAVIVVPLLVKESVDMSRTVRDIAFLSTAISGWETALIYVRTFFVLAFLAVVCLGILFGWPVIFLIVPLYILLLIRSITGKSVFLGKGRAETVKDRMKKVLNPLPDAGNHPGYRQLYQRMNEYMEEKKPYLSSLFMIDDMARDLYSNRGYISKMISLCTGMNFSQYVNHYRIEYAIDMFKKDTKLKVSELASLSGFNNKVTFNLNFKYFMDVTPKAWCEGYLDDIRRKGALSNRKGQAP